VGIPGEVESDGILATPGPTEPGFCCNTDDPGSRGVGTVWYKFVAPQTSVQLDTCCSVARPDGPADDSILSVYALAEPDRGLCSDGLTLCSVSQQDCLPDLLPCVFDEEYACLTLIPIACSDDEETCSCHGNLEPTRSKVCVSDLVPGETYYVMVGGKTDANRGVYKLRLVSPCGGTPLMDNDLSMNAEPLAGEQVVVPFDISGEAFNRAPATFDCPAPPVTCFDFTKTLQNDVWYEWTAPCDGTATFQTCGFDGDGQPQDSLTRDTVMVVYDGCVTPVEIGTEEICSWWMSSPCYSGTYGEMEVTEGNCYKVRLGGRLGKTHEVYPVGSGIFVPIAGDLRIDVVCAQCPPGSVTLVDPLEDVTDARQPHPPGDATTKQGIKELQVLAPLGAAEANWSDCWSLCETAPEGPANDISSIVDDGGGNYTITLDRAISTGEVTTITYLADGGTHTTLVLSSLPADVSGDGTSAPSDILWLIDCLNGVGTCEILQCDADRSALCGPPDILRVIDLLNGAGEFDPWLNKTLPACGVCCPP